MTEPIRYEIDLSQRVQHLVRVTMHVPEDIGPDLRLLMPTWTPGSYVIRDYVHHVQWIEVVADDGSTVELVPDGRTAWTCTAPGAELTVTWELYANSLTVRSNHVDDHHALLVSPATFILVESARDRAHHVTFSGHERVWSLLPGATGSEPGRTFVAQDADHLIDSAFEIGEHPHVEVDVRGVLHRFVWSGHGGRPDLARIGQDMEKAAEAAIELFGGELPTSEYTFLNVGWDAGGGGLEHRDGSVLMMPTSTFQDDDTYARFQSLMTHEYLHLWNVKRLVPSELVSPDPIQPTHTRLLWVAEGWTAYYDELLPLRAGQWSLDRYLKAAAAQLDGVMLRPGTAYQSVEEASYQAWTKQYVLDENSVNTGTNYYGHGAVLAWSLDLMIRARQPDSAGLDDVVRLLWQRHAQTPEGYSGEDVRQAVAEVAGDDLGGFFDAHVRGRALPPVDGLVAGVGLEVSWPVPEGGDVPYLGVDVEDPPQGGLRITAVRRGGPAWAAGVTGGDELLAVDRASLPPSLPAATSLARALRGRDPASAVTLTVRRGPRVLDLTATLGEPVRARKLSAIEQPSAEQAKAFTNWTSQPHPNA